MDDELLAEFPIWRIVGEGWATLRELETWWSMDDVARANAMLDAKNDIEAELLRK